MIAGVAQLVDASPLRGEQVWVRIPRPALVGYQIGWAGSI